MCTSKHFSLLWDFSKLKQLGGYKTTHNLQEVKDAAHSKSYKNLPSFTAPGQGSLSQQMTWAEESVTSFVPEYESTPWGANGSHSLPESLETTSEIRNYQFYSSGSSVQTDGVGLALLITM